MSFRLFVYYCALVGAWTGIAGWALGKYVSEQFVPNDWLVLQDGVRGLFLGVFVTLGLGLVDALWNIGWRRWGQLLARLGVAMSVGALGGFTSGALARWLINLVGNSVPIVVLLVFGWTIAGLFIGASIAAFEWLGAKIRKENSHSAGPKFVKCMVGGGLGGFFGGLAAYLLREAWGQLFGGKETAMLWSPTAIGFVMLGLSIGLLVGLAQVFLKEAWVKVEAGFRPGRELILTKEATVIGRAEGSDIALFGDQGVDKSHAQIVLDGVRYLVEDFGSSGGTFVNDKKVSGRVALRSGDLIRVGKSSLRFSEKKKR